MGPPHAAPPGMVTAGHVDAKRDRRRREIVATAARLIGPAAGRADGADRLAFGVVDGRKGICRRPGRWDAVVAVRAGSGARPSTAAAPWTG